MKSEDEVDTVETAATASCSNTRRRFMTDRPLPTHPRPGRPRQYTDPGSGLDSAESREVFDILRDVLTTYTQKRTSKKGTYSLPQARGPWRHVSWREQSRGHEYWTEGPRPGSIDTETESLGGGYVPTRDLEAKVSPVTFKGGHSQLSLEAGSTLFDLSSAGDTSAINYGSSSAMGLASKHRHSDGHKVDTYGNMGIPYGNPQVYTCQQHTDACFACELRELQVNVIDAILRSRQTNRLTSALQQPMVSEDRNCRSLSTGGRRPSRRSGSSVAMTELAASRRKSTDRRFSRGAPDLLLPVRYHANSGEGISEGDYSMPSVRRMTHRQADVKERLYVTTNEGALETDRSHRGAPQQHSAFSCFAPKWCFFT